MKWTPAEDRYLQEQYLKGKGIQEIALHLSRSKAAVNMRLQRLKINAPITRDQKQHNSWTDEQNELVRTLYGKECSKQIGQRLNRTGRAVIRQASKLGLTWKGEKDEVNKAPASHKVRQFSEREQRDMVHFCRLHGQVMTCSEFRIGRERLVRILDKFGFNRRGNKRSRPGNGGQNKKQAQVQVDKSLKPEEQALQKLVGQRVYYMAQERILQGYRDAGEFMEVSTLVICSQPFERTVKLPKKGLARMLREEAYFVPCG